MRSLVFLSLLCSALPMPVMAQITAIEVLAKPTLASRLFGANSPSDHQRSSTEESISTDVILKSILKARLIDIKHDPVTSAILEAHLEMVIEIQIPVGVSEEEIIAINPEKYSRAKIITIDTANPRQARRPLRLHLGRMGRRKVNSSGETKTVQVRLIVPIVKGISELGRQGQYQLTIEVYGKGQFGFTGGSVKSSLKLNIDQVIGSIEWLGGRPAADTDDDCGELLI